MPGRGFAAPGVPRSRDAVRKYTIKRSEIGVFDPEWVTSPSGERGA